MDDKKPKPPDFDWIGERNRCSVALKYEDILRLAIANVEQRNNDNTIWQKNKRFALGYPYGEGTRSFSVVDQYSTFERRWVSLDGTADTHIIVRVFMNSKTTETTYTLTVNDDGDCQLETGGIVRAPWQVLRAAFEGMFYTPLQ